MPDGSDHTHHNTGTAPPEVAGETLPSCGDFDLRIGQDGTWYYRGSPIGRQAVVKLFATVLHRRPDGYWLITPAERGRIMVDDAPFVAVEAEAAGGGRDQVVAFRTNLDHWVAAGPDHRLAVRSPPGGGEPRPYIEVRNGLEAKLARPVYYRLVDLAVEEPTADGPRLGIWSRGVFFPLGEP